MAQASIVYYFILLLPIPLKEAPPQTRVYWGPQNQSVLGAPNQSVMEGPQNQSVMGGPKPECA